MSLDTLTSSSHCRGITLVCDHLTKSYIPSSGVIAAVFAPDCPVKISHRVCEFHEIMSVLLC